MQKRCFFTDAGANIKGVFDSKRFRGRPPMERIDCAAHKLNTVLANSVNRKPNSEFLMPDAALPVVDLLKKCKELVKQCRMPCISAGTPRIT